MLGNGTNSQQAALARDIERTCDLTERHFALTAAILTEADDADMRQRHG